MKKFIILMSIAFLPLQADLTPDPLKEKIKIVIREAKKQYPNDFVMQKLIIRSQIDSFHEIKKMKDKYR